MMDDERNRLVWETLENGRAGINDKEIGWKRLQIGRGNEIDGDGRHGRMHACNAAHHGCDGLGPVHSERMTDNE